MKEVILPELGEGIAGGDIINVLVKTGDTISEGQTLCEIETDKAVVEIPSPASGTVGEVRIKKGEQAKVGSVILTLESTGAATPAASPAPTPTPSPQPAAAPTTPPPAAPAARQELPTPKTEIATPRKAGSPPKSVPAGPATRRFARELGINLSEVIGSASGGRIVIEDVKRHVRELTSRQHSFAAPGTPAPAPLPDFSKYGPIDIQPLPSLRRKIAEQMALAWQIPMVTHYDEADITDLDAFRRRFAARVKDLGGVLTVTSFALQAVADALLEFPHFNASLDLAHGTVIYKNYIHIGVAVDTESGLIVPVIRDVNKKSLKELCHELAQLSQKARDRKVTVEELRGGTFAISNLGGVGGTGFTPLVNPPQVAILGLARGAIRPVWRNNAFEPRLMLPICLSYDHRLIDGADAARFTRRVVLGLEEFAGKLL